MLILTSNLIVLSLSLVVWAVGFNNTGRLLIEYSEEEVLFDWVAYLDANLDLQYAINDASAAWSHYSTFGKKEQRTFISKIPDVKHVRLAEQKIQGYINIMETQQIPIPNRTLIMYYLPTVQDNYRSTEAVLNTLQLFAAAVISDTGESSSNLYWINIIEASNNPYLRYLPHGAFNVIIFSWDIPKTQNLITLRTLEYLNLRSQPLSSFLGSVLFLDIDTRGPFLYRHNGEWVSKYRSLLSHDHVGMAGSSLSCELVPHIQNHSYIIQSHLIPLLLQTFSFNKTYKELRALFNYNLQYLSVVIRRTHNITSLLYEHYTNTAYFMNICLTSKQIESHTSDTSHLSHRSSRIVLHQQKLLGYHVKEKTPRNPFLWCLLNLTSLIFYPWGGERSHQRICTPMKHQMNAVLSMLQQQEVYLQLQVPETVQGGLLHDLCLQYEYEVFIASQHPYQRLQLQQEAARGVGGAGKGGRKVNQVCLLIRSVFRHRSNNTTASAANAASSGEGLLDQDSFQAYDHLIQCEENRAEYAIIFCTLFIPPHREPFLYGMNFPCMG
jgi:hypothetical protein